ncbi:magnesium transporter NIPA [Actinidia rufa]|uniref:Magnesium transporter NIPA n=1 Tax=Actinidia rufa TaxID=165716 RepID=A0A7J0E6R1_9ERIC|nr:magnesium transporter NIPA [Actinidia rufa]
MQELGFEQIGSGRFDHLSLSLSLSLSPFISKWGEYHLTMFMDLYWLSPPVFSLGLALSPRRKVLKKAGATGIRAGSGGYSYLREPWWWAGMLTSLPFPLLLRSRDQFPNLYIYILHCSVGDNMAAVLAVVVMIIGEVANFAAYAYAPAILVTPLGALSIIFSAVLAHFILEEKLHIFGVVGCILCLVGSTTIVLHAPQERKIESVKEVWYLATEPGFLVYSGIVLVAVIVLIFLFVPRYGATHLIVYIGICSLTGSLTVMSVKAVGIALKLSFSGSNQFIYFQTWFFTIFVIFGCLLQLNYLNKALDTFNTAVVSPVYYVMFTTLTILASMIMFKDWGTQNASQIVTELCGFVTILSGTFLLHKTKDMGGSPSPTMGSSVFHTSPNANPRLVDCYLGRVIHGVVVKIRIEFDSFVQISLVDMYVKVELLGCALRVFDESPERNKLGSKLLWNVLINGCCKVGDLRKAVELFEAMPERNVGSWNSLINGFMRDSEVERARELFDCMREKNVVSWTTMVTGYSQNGHHEKALSMFSNMLEVGVKPNDLTVVSALSAFAKIGALEAGVQIHKYLSSNGFQLNKANGTALVDMYAKCGNIESANRVFGMTKEMDLRTWSVMICFSKEYFGQGVKPDGVVFLAILTACSHSGQVDKGLRFFDSMRLDYSIEPTTKHYALIVDLLGRAGRLDEALSFIKSMPLDPDIVIWGALFCACRAHRNIEIAEWEDVERVRTSMQNRGAEKDLGWSYIEVVGQVHRFVAGDRAHEHMAEIHKKLEEITRSARKQGYIPETEWVLHNIEEEEEKEDALGSHSEKLALAFALISTSPKTTIRIVKNLRVCGDCHSMMKYVSRMNEREIILRDIKRFHHFKDGICSCGDYW